MFRFLRSGFPLLTFISLRLLFTGWIQAILSYSSPILRDLTRLHYDTQTAWCTPLLSYLLLCTYAMHVQRQVLFGSYPFPLTTSVRFWRWIDRDDPDYSVTNATSFTEERFLRGHPFTDLENSTIHSRYQLKSAGLVYTSLQLCQAACAQDPGPSSDISIWTDESYDDSLE
jgi:hypothetical protein